MSIINNVQFELNNIEKRFPGVHALNNVSIKINKNEVVGLVGENGAGKTTLIKLLIGLLHPSSGRVKINGFIPWERKYSLMHKNFHILY